MGFMANVRFARANMVRPTRRTLTLGGGLELALACRYRIATERTARDFAFTNAGTKSARNSAFRTRKNAAVIFANESY